MKARTLLQDKIDDAGEVRGRTETIDSDQEIDIRLHIGGICRSLKGPAERSCRTRSRGIGDKGGSSPHLDCT